MVFFVYRVNVLFLSERFCLNQVTFCTDCNTVITHHFNVNPAVFLYHCYRIQYFLLVDNLASCDNLHKHINNLACPFNIFFFTCHSKALSRDAIFTESALSSILTFSSKFPKRDAKSTSCGTSNLSVYQVFPPPSVSAEIGWTGSYIFV